MLLEPNIKKETSLFGINYGTLKKKSKGLHSIINSVDNGTYGNNYTGVTSNCTIQLWSICCEKL